MDRIDERDFLADPQATIDRARCAGETVEIVRDGRIIARLVPEPSPPGGGTVQPGGSRGVMRSADPDETLDDLLTPADVAAWYAASDPDVS